MKTEEIIDLCTKIKGLDEALGAEFGRYVPLKGLSFDRELIDADFLARTLSEYKEGFCDEDNDYISIWRNRCESLHVVYEDGSLVKSEHVDYRAVGTNEDSWTGGSSSHEIYWEDGEEEILPIANFFTSDRPIRHAILIKTTATIDRGKEKIEAITITVYEPQSDTTETAVKLMDIFWELGFVYPHYLEDDL